MQTLINFYTDIVSQKFQFPFLNLFFLPLYLSKIVATMRKFIYVFEIYFIGIQLIFTRRVNVNSKTLFPIYLNNSYTNSNMKT